MNKHITAIICAMEEETAAFRSIEQDDIRIIKSGVGKVHAAVATTTAIEEGATQIISTGYAGALSPFVKKGDFVLALKAMQHDIDATCLGVPRGQIPFTDCNNWTTNAALTVRLILSTIERRYQIHAGQFLSGDRFVTDRASLSMFGGMCVDMETAAIAHTCHLRHIPWASIRIVSDEANSSSSLVFTESVKEKASKLEELARIIKAALTSPPWDAFPTPKSLPS